MHEYKVGDRVEVIVWPLGASRPKWVLGTVASVTRLETGNEYTVDAVGAGTRWHCYVYRESDIRPAPASKPHKLAAIDWIEPASLSDFDEGGLRRTPDGLLESVHVPSAQEEQDQDQDQDQEDYLAGTGYVGALMENENMIPPNNAVQLPYTATGTGTKPVSKVQWSVEYDRWDNSYAVRLLDSMGQPVPGLCGRVLGTKAGWFSSKPKSVNDIESEIADLQADLLSRFRMIERCSRG